MGAWGGDTGACWLQCYAGNGSAMKCCTFVGSGDGYSGETNDYGSKSSRI